MAWRGVVWCGVLRCAAVRSALGHWLTCCLFPCDSLDVVCVCVCMCVVHVCTCVVRVCVSCSCAAHPTQASGLDTALARSYLEKASLDHAQAAGLPPPYDLDQLSNNVGAVVYGVGVVLALAMTAIPSCLYFSARRLKPRMQAVFLEPGEQLSSKPRMAIPRPSLRMAWHRVMFVTCQGVR